MRALRVLLLANDGFSAGHVVRTIAIARALARRSKARAIDVQLLLATTSQAHALLTDRACAVVQLPAPVVAREAGFSDGDRRRLVRGTLAGAIEAFGPDVLVCDTFPSGPHAELAGIGLGRAKRVLVRRAVPESRDAVLTDGLGEYDGAIVADDPGPTEATLPIPIVRVPPITLGEEGKSRDEARSALGIPRDARALLVASGGGGDRDAADRAAAIAEAIARVEPQAVVTLARGPLFRHDGANDAKRLVPLQPWLAAFDGAFAPAGYNTAHELAKARVPAALFAQPRPFDDQAGRAARFAAASLATKLDRFDDEAIAAALASMRTPARIEHGGADRAADAVLDMVMR